MLATFNTNFFYIFIVHMYYALRWIKQKAITMFIFSKWLIKIFVCASYNLILLVLCRFKSILLKNGRKENSNLKKKGKIFHAANPSKLVMRRATELLIAEGIPTCESIIKCLQFIGINVWEVQ